MATRFKFAVLAGVAGLLFGSILAMVLKKEGEPFPTYVVVASAATFAVSGAIAKKEWAEDVLGFFIPKIF